MSQAPDDLPTDVGSRPNILFICTDQQRFDAMGAYGNPEVRTPNLDRLAEQSVLFESCYVQNPVCSPSRASLMTGEYVPVHGLHANGVDLAPSHELFTKTLSETGYDCGLVGKLHLGACWGGRSEPRLDDGFRVFRWAHDPYPGSSENAYHRWLQAKAPDLYAEALSGEGEHTWDTLPTEVHYSRWVAEETIDYLRDSRDREKPFCLVANFFDPHHGFGAPSEYRDAYDAQALSRPVTRPGELEDKPPIQREASEKSYAGAAKGFLEYTAEELQEVRAAYYGMVTLVDAEVGRILAALDEEGLADDTVVVFTSDHGEMLGDHQLMLKGPFMYECAIRVPLLVRWPGTARPGRREQLVQWVDLAPTFLEAAGIAPSDTHQGTSLVPLLEDAGTPWRDWAVSHYRDSGQSYDPAVHVTMLRHDRWKLVVHHGEPASGRARTGELYDLVDDPEELDNLWSSPDHASVRAQLHERLVDTMVATEDRSRPRLSAW